MKIANMFCTHHVTGNPMLRFLYTLPHLIIKTTLIGELYYSHFIEEV